MKEDLVSMCIKTLKKKQRAFTMVELLVGIAIVAILAAVALPSLKTFTVSMRVDNEISELHRLLLIARNTSVNSGQDVVVCPIVNGSCTDDWTQEVSVFIDFNQNNDFDIADDEIVRVKSAISSSNDQFQYSNGAFLTYNSLGNLPINNNESTFSYCPYGYADASRGIIVAVSGRAYISNDSDSDGVDEDRNNVNITCS
ncbi:GspH/FimT family protein [Pseudocolwellia sp. AS88]|uniref:GspH/FimT family pseudopilin n=1 Tax=Pseudocolwellia sp. AS88 TaxID=3063958 RepID=UPI0026F10156|nr:GspH/FimT family protein [Pseudocolwellia sp. AS88]MDO7086588.1 GspH/FimT family protein [Pseudocolwellia sp. AS88]